MRNDFSLGASARRHTMTGLIDGRGFVDDRGCSLFS